MSKNLIDMFEAMKNDEKMDGYGPAFAASLATVAEQAFSEGVKTAVVTMLLQKVTGITGPPPENPYTKYVDEAAMDTALAEFAAMEKNAKG